MASQDPLLDLPAAQTLAMEGAELDCGSENDPLRLEERDDSDGRGDTGSVAGAGALHFFHLILGILLLFLIFFSCTGFVHILIVFMCRSPIHSL